MIMANGHVLRHAVDELLRKIFPVLEEDSSERGEGAVIIALPHSITVRDK